MKSAAWRVGAVLVILALAYITAGVSGRWFADTFLIIEPPRDVVRVVTPPEPVAQVPPAEAGPAPVIREGNGATLTKRPRRVRERASQMTKSETRERRCAHVSRREVRARVLDPGSLQRVRIAVQDQGIALSRVSGTPLTRLGFRDGDIVTRIQGAPATVDAALALLAAVDRVSEIRATVLRGTRRIGLCVELTDELTDE